MTPLITVGDTLAGGYRYESIPDGISFQAQGGKHKGKDKGHGKKHGAKNDPRTVDLYINHETSFVPFPYTPSAPTEANSQNDFDNSQESHLVLNGETAGILSGEMVIKSAQNYQRFCSNFLATKENGFNQAAPVCKRGGDRLGQARRKGVPGHDRRGRRAADRRRRRLRPEEGQEQADLGHGPVQPREQRRGARLRPSCPPVGRRRVRERPGAVPGVQLHREELECSLEGQGRPLGVRLRHTRVQRLRRLRSRLDAGRPGPLREGAEEHRHRPQPGRHRDDGGRRRLSRAPEYRLADRERRRHRRAAMGARALERPERRVPVHADRGHGL